MKFTAISHIAFSTPAPGAHLGNQTQQPDSLLPYSASAALSKREDINSEVPPSQ